LLDRWLDRPYWLLLIGLSSLIGAWAAQVAGRNLAQPDSGHIVIDEIVAFWLVLALLPTQNPVSWEAAAAFAVFRFFDVLKPPPIRWFDVRLKHGIGVMLDDLLAALYTLLVLALWRHFAAG
jgi:phosphatidylglycerophosphatase A